MTDVDAIVSMISAARRRLRLATFARWACTTMAVATAAIAAASVLAGGQVDLVRLSLIAGAAALATAAAIAIAMTPTPAQAAVLLDACLGLEDRAAAAFALRSSAEPIAALILGDARQTLADVDLRRVWPWPHRRVAWTASGILAIVIVAAIASGPSTGGPATSSGAARVISGGSSAQAATRTPSADARRAAAARPPVSSPPQVSPDGAKPTPSPAGAASRQAPAVLRQDKTAEAAPRGNAGGPSGAAARRGGSAADRSGNAGRGASAANAGAGAAAGGVRQGVTLEAVAADSSTAASAPATPTAGELRRARAGAEAALARDEIPPRLKNYVRDYFRAIQSEQSR